MDLNRVFILTLLVVLMTLSGNVSSSSLSLPTNIYYNYNLTGCTGSSSSSCTWEDTSRWSDGKSPSCIGPMGGENEVVILSDNSNSSSTIYTLLLNSQCIIDSILSNNTVNLVFPVGQPQQLVYQVNGQINGNNINLEVSGKTLFLLNTNGTININSLTVSGIWSNFTSLGGNTITVLGGTLSVLDQSTMSMNDINNNLSVGSPSAMGSIQVSGVSTIYIGDISDSGSKKSSNNLVNVNVNLMNGSVFQVNSNHVNITGDVVVGDQSTFHVYHKNQVNINGNFDMSSSSSQLILDAPTASHPTIFIYGDNTVITDGCTVTTNIYSEVDQPMLFLLLQTTGHLQVGSNVEFVTSAQYNPKQLIKSTNVHKKTITLDFDATGDNSSDSKGGAEIAGHRLPLSKGALAGIVIAGFSVLVLIGFIIYRVVRKPSRFSYKMVKSSENINDQNEDI